MSVGVGGGWRWGRIGGGGGSECWFRGGLEGRRGEKAKSKICYRKNRALHATAADLSTLALPFPSPPLARFSSLDLAQPRPRLARDPPSSLDLAVSPTPCRRIYPSERAWCVVARVGVSLTRVRVCRAAWRRTVRNMCTIKYTHGNVYLRSRSLRASASSFSRGVARARVYMYIYTYVRVCADIYAGWCAFSAGIRDIGGLCRVPDTRPLCSRSLNTISCSNRGLFSLFLPSAGARTISVASFAPRIRGICRTHGETSRPEDDFIRGKWSSPQRESIESNRVFFPFPAERKAELFISRWFKPVQTSPA